MFWNSALYDSKHDFVAEYGKGLLEFIPNDKSQRILDLGCGTGTLTSKLTGLCHTVLGVDSSKEMIDKAQNHFPELDFQVCDALSLPFVEEWDVVFSNAVFHWINDHHTLLHNINCALKPGGLLVCEFGAHGNISTIENAFARAAGEAGYPYQPKFNFQSAEAFGSILREEGFVIDKLYDFDRPTALKDGEGGLENWMRQFFASELAAMPQNMQMAVIKKVEEIVKDTLWNGREWTADYRRLRAVAKKCKK